MTTKEDNRTRSIRAQSARPAFPLFRFSAFPLFRRRGAAAPSAPRAAQAARGFTLVEILVVVCVITILVGLTANATNSARQRAWVSQATTEADQLCAALKAYRLAAENGKLPFDTRGQWVDVTRDLIADLIGEGSGDDPVLLDIADDRFDRSGDKDLYLDPWGNPYQIRTYDPSSDEGSGEAGDGQAGNIVLEETFEVVASFPNQFGRAGEL